MTDRRIDKSVRVRVAPLPAWLDLARFLGVEFSRADGAEQCAEAELSPEAAAALCARLRGIGVDGAPLTVSLTPPLGRGLVRAARLEDARARRETTPAFLRRGARVSGEGRYSLTPEALAMSMASAAQGKRVVDASCGSGGNALAFARSGCEVVAIDVEAERLAEAEHNARLYGVAQRIRFVHGDARELVPQLAADILFVDPPWGLEYDKRTTARADFPLLDALLSLPAEALARYPARWLKLPASFATSSLPGARAEAVFGTERGDFQRIKFLLVQLFGSGAGGGTGS